MKYLMGRVEVSSRTQAPRDLLTPIPSPVGTSKDKPALVVDQKPPFYTATNIQGKIATTFVQRNAAESAENRSAISSSQRSDVSY
jgi:hypothetical protein